MSAIVRTSLVQFERKQNARAGGQLAVGLVDQIFETQRLKVDDGECCRRNLEVELRGHFEHQLLDLANLGQRQRRMQVRVFETKLFVDLGAQFARLHPRDDAGHETCNVCVGW